MSSRVAHTPEGVTDILSDECELKFNIEKTACEVFKQHGYKIVQPPTFEYYDVYDIAATTKAENMFKFFDTNGRMLALRPDLTTSIARIAATKAKTDNLPLKLCYRGSAFRNDEAFSQARQREFSQVGIELIGEKSAAADAEVISVAVEALLKLGLTRFQIDIGQVDFFKGLIEQAGIDEYHAQQLQKAVDSKDIIRIEAISKEVGISDNLKEIFSSLPTMFGDVDVVQSALEIPNLNKRSQAGLENILDVYEILHKNGIDNYISVDLGLVPNLDYYTGIILKGAAHGVGFPICAGGRYDNLTAKFGKEMPATGVAIGVERVMTVLSEENVCAGEQDAKSDYVTVALAKGRLSELSVEIFEKIGFDVRELKQKSRKLIFTDEKNKMKFILVKASDVPTYVEYGAADIGVVGKDTLIESGKNLYEVLDLGFGACKMAVAGPKEMRGKLEGRNIMKVASKYPKIARDYFHKQKGQTVDIIKLNGSVELGPLVGLSEVIVDIVESGKTLKENGLEVLEEICGLSARLVVNRVSIKLKREKIFNIIGKMKGEVS